MATILSSLSGAVRRSFLGLILTATTALAVADPSGVWKLNLEGPDGRSLPSTLTLSWQEGRLTGTIDNRAGPAETSRGQVNGDEISFRVVREFGRRLRKKTVVSDYTAKLQDDRLEGRIQTVDRKGQPRSLPFSATREP